MITVKLISIVILSLVVAWGLKGRANKDILKYASLMAIFLVGVYAFHEHYFNNGVQVLQLTAPSKSNAAFLAGYSFVFGGLIRVCLAVWKGTCTRPQS